MQEGSTPLYVASFAGNVEEVKMLLDGGTNVNEQNDVSLITFNLQITCHVYCVPVQNAWGDTALIGACKGGQVETAQVLLDHGVIVDIQTKVIEVCYVKGRVGARSATVSLCWLVYCCRVESQLLWWPVEEDTLTLSRHW